MQFHRRHILGSAMGAALLPSVAVAQTTRPFPTRAVTIYQPTPGGLLDVMSRLLAGGMNASWGQPVVVESKLGAGGSVAAALLAKAPPDGHLLLVGGSAIVNNTLGNTVRGYTLDDLAPVHLLAILPTAFGVRASLGVKTMAEYVALAKSRPGKLTFSSSGIGTGTHIAGELVNLAAGIDTVHVPYKGESQALVDLMGGRIDGTFGSLFGLSQHPGEVVILAVASPSRLPSHPDIPTFSEVGLQNANKPGWVVMFAAAKTPKSTIDTIAAEVRRSLALPETVAKFREFGFVPGTMGPEQTADFLQAHVKQMRSLQEMGRVKFE